MFDIVLLEKKFCRSSGLGIYSVFGEFDVFYKFGGDYVLWSFCRWILKFYYVSVVNYFWKKDGLVDYCWKIIFGESIIWENKEKFMYFKDKVLKEDGMKVKEMFCKVDKKEVEGVCSEN